MRSRFYWLLFPLLLLSIGFVSAEGDSAPYRMVAYFSSWSIYGRNFYVTDIPAAKLTHINYAFFNISNTGKCVLGDEGADTQIPYPGDQKDEKLLGNFKQLQLLKKSHPGLRTLM